jgi:signal peptidase II
VDSLDADASAPPDQPPARRAGRFGLILGVAFVVILLDQLSKDWAVGRLSPDPFDRGIHVIGDFRFKLAFNSGMAFSQGEGKGALIGGVALLIVVALLWFARSVTDRPTRIALGLVLGGALGNLIDRFARAGTPGVPRGFMGGRVVDFFYVGWYPTFNVADACVVVGGILLAILTIRAPSEPEREAEPGADAAAEAPGTPQNGPE